MKTREFLGDSGAGYQTGIVRVSIEAGTRETGHISLNSAKTATRRRDETFRMRPKWSQGRTFFPFTYSVLMYPGNQQSNRPF